MHIPQPQRVFEFHGQHVVLVEQNQVKLKPYNYKYQKVSKTDGIPDEVVKKFVSDHPYGASTGLISEAIGSISEQGVRYIVDKALAKIKKEVMRRGYNAKEFDNFVKITEFDYL